MTLLSLDFLKGGFTQNHTVKSKIPTGSIYDNKRLVHQEIIYRFILEDHFLKPIVLFEISISRDRVQYEN